MIITKKQISLALFLSSSITLAEDNKNIADLSLFDLTDLKVVTASKSQESLQETPGVVEVVTAADIENYGARDLMEVLDKACSTFGMSGWALPDMGMLTMRGDSPLLHTILAFYS